MKTQLLGLSAAALLLAAAPASHAAPSETQAYADRAQARAEALLHEAGVDLAGRSVAVRATVRSDGHLSGAYVVDSSGSRDVDYAVETVVKKVVVGEAPLGLIGGAVTIRVGPPPIVAAAAR